jgi:hypothetical protein
MSSREILWWAEADQLGLLPDPIADLATLRATLTNCAAGAQVATIEDYLPPAYKGTIPDDPATVEQHMLAKVECLKGYFQTIRAHAQSGG